MPYAQGNMVRREFQVTCLTAIRIQKISWESKKFKLIPVLLAESYMSKNVTTVML